MTFLFVGKSHAAIETIAVSQDEQYIACFEAGDGHKIRCFYADGSLSFDYSVPSDISAGGYCTLWFEGDVLYSLYYRTDKVVCFSVDGTILDVFENESDSRPPKFPAFTRKGNQYIFNGDKIEVIYDKRSFFGYWIFGAERYLAITPQEEETKIAYAWTA